MSSALCIIVFSLFLICDFHLLKINLSIVNSSSDKIEGWFALFSSRGKSQVSLWSHAFFFLFHLQETLTCNDKTPGKLCTDSSYVTVALNKERLVGIRDPGYKFEIDLGTDEQLDRAADYGSGKGEHFFYFDFSLLLQLELFLPMVAS